MKHKLTVFCFTLLLPLLSFAQAVIDACPKGFTTVVKAGPSVKHTLLPRTAAPQAISAAPTNLAIDPGLQQHIAGYFSDRHEPGFEENKGQVSDDNGNPQHEVLFRTKGEGVEIYITTKGITYFFTRTFVDESFQPEPWVNQTEFPALVKHAMTTRYKTEWHRVDMVLQNANISRDAIEKQMPSGVPVRYYMASCPAGVSDVYRYQQLTFRNVYPGIDWVLYQDEAEGMKYEFVVHAGNDASAIQMSFTGAGEISLEENGGLKISSVLGEISENAPVSYLQGSRKTVLTDFLLKKASGEQTIVSFNIGEYDHTKTLVIDPPLVWATYHGGVQTEWLNKMCVDGAGNVYAAGTTNSVNFPLVNPGGGAYFQAVALNSTNITILQFTPAGVITWATCHGGTGQDFVADIVSNPATNSVYVTGFTTSVNMPTQNPLGGAYFQNLYGGGTYDFILLQFNTAGVREWATYIGGSANDSGFSAATDANGNLFYTGFSFSGNFPTVNPGGGAYFDNTLNGQDELVIMKISSTRAMVWSTLYGGNNYDDGTDVAIDATGNVWVGGSSQSTGGTCPVLNPGGTAFFQGANAGGREALLLKFTNNGVQLWGSLYGGSGEDAIYTVTMDVGGNFYCTGFSSTAGAGFPTLNPGGGAYYQAGSAGLQDGIILKFNNNCQRIWATRYGGGNNDNGSDLMLDTGGNLYIVGNTSSINFPTQNPGCTFFQGINGGGYDAFILQFTAATGVRIWATYYGGTAVDYGNGLTTHPSGALFAVGVANSAAIPLVNPGGGAYYQNASAGVQDGFILKFEPTNITTNTVVTNASCNGVCDGSATATSVGGTGPYTYNWTPSGGNNATANNLCAGTYSVYITDNIGCLDTATLTITQPGALLATLASSTNVTCNGFCDGSATAGASGGNAPYGFSWLPSGGNAATASNLCPATYTCTITDDNGCIATQSVTITEPVQLTVALSSTPANCNGSADGSATAVVNGGTVPYTYNWNPTGGNSATANGLSQGNYSCVVSDTNGCGGSFTVAVTQPTPIAATMSSVSANCGSRDGEAIVTASGGTGPYTYLWTPSGQTTDTASNLPAALYSCTVTDDNGCAQTFTVQVNTTNAPVPSVVSLNNTSCFNSTDGGATVGVTSGTSPFTYSWTSGGNAATENNLAAGSHICTVTDSAGCSASVTVTITEPPLLTSSFSNVTDNICYNGSTGSATILPAGGTGPYNYSWSTSPAQTNATATGLQAGNYICTVTDSKGCTHMDTVSIAQPAQLVGSTSSVPSNCGQPDGSASVTVNGGTPGYTYQWLPSGGNAATETGLIPGTYTVNLTDTNGCTASATIVVNSVGLLNVSTAVSNVSCFNGSDGSATATASNGTAPYAYSWNTGDSVQNVNGLPAGTYVVNIVDDVGCTSTQTVVITEPPAMQLTIGSPGSIICAGQNATIGVVATGGTPGYQYLWNTLQTSATIVQLPSVTTTYSVGVTDANGCFDSISFTITVNQLPVVTMDASDTNGCGSVCVQFSTTTQGTYAWNFGNTATSTQQNPYYCYTVPGVYPVTLTVTDNNGCIGSNTAANWIEVYPEPIAGFTTSGTEITIINPVIHLIDNSSGANQWLWSMSPDPSSQTSTQPNCLFNCWSIGTYTITQVVTNSYGCTDSTSLEFSVVEDVVIYTPNAITPNNDGLNDTWLPKGIGIDESTYHLFIFDRWGNQIFESTDWNTGWDGRANGGSDFVQQDVYVWKISVMDYQGRMHKQTGHVSVLR